VSFESDSNKYFTIMSIRIIARQMSCHLNRSVRPAVRNRLNLRHKSTAEGSFSTSNNLKQAASSTKSNESQSVPLLQTGIAAALGIATVSVTAATVEIATSSNCPDFDPNGQRFDQSTFIGRFSKMILACDPRLLLYSEAETRSAKEMVEDYKNLLQNLPEGMTIRDMNHALWEAQRISSASLHPDTGEVIPAPFRMSGYVPFNGPICVSMVASTSTPALLFWSWINQSHNALVNYYNRNASSEMSNKTLAKSYCAAVASSLIVAFGLSTFIQK